MAGAAENSNNNNGQQRFRMAFTESCNELDEAIRSLDNLNKRIDAFRASDVWLSSPIIKQTLTNIDQSPTTRNNNNNNNIHFKTPNNNNHIQIQTSSSSLLPTQQPTLESSVTLIQNLLIDTQRQCTKMVDDNQLLANHLDNELGRCQEQVDGLRKELTYAHRCVNDLEVNMMINGSATESDTEGQNADHETAEAEIYRLREENSRLLVQLKSSRQEILTLKMRNDNNSNVNVVNNQQQQQRQHQQQQNRSINNGLVNSDDRNGNNLHNDNNNNNNNDGNRVVAANNNDQLAQTLNNLQLELSQTKEALIVLKNDRKRLKAEKLELLNQMKEVYQTLESKERELRDFIRQFEQKMRDSDKGIKELIWEKEKAEKEKQTLEQALEKTEEKMNLMKNDLEKEQNDNVKLKWQLKELQGRFVLLTGQSATTVATCTQIPTPSIGYSSMSSTSPASVGNAPMVSDCPVVLDHRRSLERQSRSSPSNNDDEAVVQDVVAQQPTTSSADRLVGPPRRPRLGRKDSSSQERNSYRLSKLFNIRRSKSKDEQHSGQGSLDEEYKEDVVVIDPISADLCLAEKADQLIQARKIPFARWRQSHILAWLELELGMVQYAKTFAENVKSGRVLMSLSDNDIESTLNVTNVMHKKKLRLAIEEYRAPSLCKFPCIKEVTTHYVCSNFLPVIGLAQYTETFKQNSIDGRILNYLNKKQLEKYLNITKRFHQISILKGIELLRLFNYDIKTLNKRRIDCDRENTDLLVWTNARLVKWLQQIDLYEYAENVRDSGIHGAVAVLDSSFTSDTLAGALCIAPSKQMIRKHLADEFEPLQHQARTRLTSAHTAAVRDNRISPKRSGSLGRTFVRSYTVNGDGQSFDQLAAKNSFNKKRNGLRGSIGRVFGLKSRRDDDDFLDLSPVRNNNNQNDLDNQRQQQEHKNNGSSPKTLNHSTGTISSATSDLGSSIERSQHMKTILATPQVLIQPPMTSLSPSASNGNKTSSSTNDFSHLQHLCLSPGEGVNAGGGVAVRMRQKKQQPSTQIRSPGAKPAVAPRPHSVGEFGVGQNNLHKQHSMATATSVGKAGGGNNGTSLFSPQRLQNWLSLDHVSQNIKATDEPAEQKSSTGDRHMGTIVEQGEFELETDIMEYKSVGGDEIIWHNSRRNGKHMTTVKSTTASTNGDSPGHNRSRPKSLPIRSSSVDNCKAKPSLTSLDTVHETDL